MIPKMNPVKKIAPGIWVLGFASFLTDISSEMIYPLLPLFLTKVLGASMTSLGLIEGIAEATAGLSKIYAGVLTDRLRRRKPLILWGYGLSGAMRPLIGLAVSWWMVLFFRFADRIGKGIRTAPRDALIADMTPPGQRGTAYGIHRAMDHGGSVGGALIAGFLLTYVGLELRNIFLLAGVPAALTLLVLWVGVREDGQSIAKDAARETLPSYPSLKKLAEHYQKMDPSYRKMLACLFVFTLGDVSDAFLLMHLHSVGIATTKIPMLWILLNLVKMGASAFGGRYSDRIGHRRMIFMGWFYVSCIYGAFALTRDPTVTVVLFVIYGAYFGFTEPAERALVANLTGDQERGMAFGLLHFTIAMAVLPAGLIFGTLWEVIGESRAFMVSSTVTMGAAGALLWMLPRVKKT